MPSETIDIVISDDHAIFREGLRALLGAEPSLRIVGEAANGEETIALVCRLKPQVLLLDLSMPKTTGLEVLRELNRMGVRTRTIVLTAEIEGEQVVKALRRGAYGVVMKHSAIQLLVKCIRCVNEGQYWLGQDNMSVLLEAFRRNPPPPAESRDFGLTAREREVIALVGAGCTNKDIAQKLEISENTAKHHLTNIFDKLGVDNRTALVFFARGHVTGGQV